MPRSNNQIIYNYFYVITLLYICLHGNGNYALSIINSECTIELYFSFHKLPQNLHSKREPGYKVVISTQRDGLFGVRIPVCRTDFLLTSPFHVGSAVLPTSCRIRSRGFLLSEVKQPGRGVDHPRFLATGFNVARDLPLYPPGPALAC
jgi:hypothetical protein